MSNTSTTKTAGNNAGAAEEIAVNETVNGKTANCKIESADKERREKQLRCMAAKMGLVVRKSRRKHATDADKGLYRLYRLSDLSGQVIAGATYNLSLDELSKAISDRSAAADNAEENAAEATQTKKEATPHTRNRGNTGTAVRSGKG